MESTSFIIKQPDDWHLHLRDSEILETVIGDSARQFARAIVMPNLNPPIVNVKQALLYRKRILKALNKVIGYKNLNFVPLMTLYLTNYTSLQDVQDAVLSDKIFAFKFYPAGVTTNSNFGVSDLLSKCSAILDILQKFRIPLLIHGEIPDQDIDIFDRESVFIDRVMIPLRRSYPELKIVLEHISTKNAVEYILSEKEPIAATITPQHLLYNRNSIFQDGIRVHRYCLPLLKSEKDRKALLKAATSGNKRFFLGTDSAPHLQNLKEYSCGRAGCYTAINAMALYATAFEEIGCLDKLEGFSSFYGPDFYGLPRNIGDLMLFRQKYQVPNNIRILDDYLIPLTAGEYLYWQVKKL